MAKRVVRFLAGSYPWQWTRQTPANDGIFGDSHFLFGDGIEDADWLVVYDEVPRGYAKDWDPQRTLFVATEPVNVKRYGDKFLEQFGTILTTDRKSRHPNIIYTHAALPWHVGMQVGMNHTYGSAMNFSDFQSDYPTKTKLCSVICSNKTISPQHTQRLAFVQLLKSAFGDQIDVFGRGFVNMIDKDEALAAYRYHIALENCDFEDYWTEKLADPLLRGCYPLYWGSKNIEKYFSPEALTRIDILQPEQALKTIAEVINGDTDIIAQTALTEARRKVLWEHNLFAVLDKTLGSLEKAMPKSEARVSIHPESFFCRASIVRQSIDYARRALTRLKY